MARIFTRLIAVVAAGSCFGLTACGGGFWGEGEAGQNEPVQQGGQGDGGAAGGGPAAQGVLGGEPFEMTPDDDYVCHDTGGTFMVSATNTESQGIVAQLDGEEGNTVKNFTMSHPNGPMVTVDVEVSSEESWVSVSKDGSTYTFTGKGLIIDPEAMAEAEAGDFEATVTCP